MDYIETSYNALPDAKYIKRIEQARLKAISEVSSVPENMLDEFNTCLPSVYEKRYDLDFMKELKQWGDDWIKRGRVTAMEAIARYVAIYLEPLCKCWDFIPLEHCSTNCVLKGVQALKEDEIIDIFRCIKLGISERAWLMNKALDYSSDYMKGERVVVQEP